MARGDAEPKIISAFLLCTMVLSSHGFTESGTNDGYWCRWKGSLKCVNYDIKCKGQGFVDCSGNPSDKGFDIVVSILNSTSMKSMLKDAMASFKNEGGQDIVSFLESIINGQRDVSLGPDTAADEEGDDEGDEINFFDIFGDPADSQPDPTEMEDADESMEGQNFLEIFGFADETAEVAEARVPQKDEGASEAVLRTSILLEVLRNDDFLAPANDSSLENVTSERAIEENSQITEDTGSELRENTTLVPLGETLAEGNITSTESTKSDRPSVVNGTEDLPTPSANASLPSDQRRMRKKRSELTEIMRRYKDVVKSLTPAQITRHGLAIKETVLFLKEVLSNRQRSIRGAAMDDTPLLPGIRREKGKCRVFNMSCIELPPLSTCRGVSLGGCLSRSKLYLFMMPRYILAIIILTVAVISIGSMVAAFEIYRRVTNRRVIPAAQENEGDTEMEPNNNPMNGN